MLLNTELDDTDKQNFDKGLEKMSIFVDKKKEQD